VTELAASGHGITLSGPLATVLASIAGALITGFGAAALRHAWDVRADVKSWNRSRDQRVRAQLLEAFGRYLAARPDLRSADVLRVNRKEGAVIVSSLQLAAASLLILLTEAGDRQVVEKDCRALEDWVEAALQPRSIEDETGVPDAGAILDLARRLAVEPS
jgi:hypothetical protein